MARRRTPGGSPVDGTLGLFDDPAAPAAAPAPALGAAKKRGAKARTTTALDVPQSAHVVPVAGDPEPLVATTASVAEPRPRVSDLYEEAGDAFPGATSASAIAISTLTETAKDVLEGAFIPLWVRGEVTGFKAHRNGHWYFTLRDEAAQLRCVVWSRDRRAIPAPPDEGMQVTAFGQLTVYAARGEMQFTIRRMEAAGDGLWRKALELLRAKLDAEGLLAPARKRALPRHPRTIAVITSPDGAALHDIAAVMRRRAPGVRLVVIPAAVQGESAPDELCAALDRLARWRGADLVIVGRGGGSREDLWAFNDERVARAVAACPIPTISAVGHEIDVTICDLVADLRAPTPSAAAEAAVRSAEELRAELRALAHRAASAMGGHVWQARDRVKRGGGDLALYAGRAVERRRLSLQAAAGKLHALSPLATLARGYAVARSPEGETLSSVAQFAPDSRFDLLVRDGIVRATTNETRRTPHDGGTP